MVNKYILVAAITICVIYVLRLCVGSNTKEGYQMTLGMLKPQRRSYDRCVSDCVRNRTGLDYNGQFRWTCVNQCQEETNEIISQNIQSDMAIEEHQRHFECMSGNKAMPDVDECYCKNEIKIFCNERVCNNSFDKSLVDTPAFPFSQGKEKCVESCIRVKTPDCTSGMSGGWLP